MEAFSWCVLIFFAVATTALAVYGLHLYVLLYLFVRRRTARRSAQREIIARYRRETSDADWPAVVSQIPIYNEAEVCARVIESVAAMRYPTGKHTIQVLDDSSDHTAGLVDDVVASLRDRGVSIEVIRRPQRVGYKAGALTYGLERTGAEFVSVFDADFVPHDDFLLKAVPLLVHAPDLACLQGRWSHLNRGESWLTEAQALGIDGHFAIEQGARAWNGLMMNFNGTAGVWRKAAIEDPSVGGWSGDTLTEDLDLSYRAQLAGWRLDYCLDLPCPAELPGTINAFKSQQRRWATGSIQVARKLLPVIWRTKRSLGEKVEATLHLTHYTVAVWMLILAIVARPMLFVFAADKIFTAWFWLGWTAIFFSAVAPSLTYSYARYSLGGGWSGLKHIPRMIILGCGLCVNNSLAVVTGLVQRGGEFVRTPKSGNRSEGIKLSSYGVASGNLWAVELILGLYCSATFIAYFTYTKSVVSVFLFLYALGFLTVGWMSAPWRTTRELPASAEGSKHGEDHAEQAQEPTGAQPPAMADAPV